MSKQKKPKVLYLDIECSRTTYLVKHYTGRDVGYLSHKDIIEPWYITCAAWSWLDLKTQKIGKVTVSKVSDFVTYDKNHRDDLGVIMELAEAINQADLIIGHNAANFDMKKINTRVIYHKLPPLEMPPVIDTLKAARKYSSFQSKSLEYLAKQLDCEFQKVKLPPGTMHKADDGCEKSLKALADYNVGDIKSGASLYFALMPYIGNHPDLRKIMASMNKEIVPNQTLGECNTCGSSNVRSLGVRANKSGPYRRLVCLDCGSPTQGKLKTIKVKKK